MTIEHAILAIAAASVLLTTVQGVWALLGGFALDRHVRRQLAAMPSLRDAAGRFRFQPRVTVFLPCKGIDDRMRQTVALLGEQEYDDYEVVFAFESVDDPAYAAVGQWTSDWTRPRARRVVAGHADGRSQKVHNLLKAVSAASDDREVFVFLDSDALPPRDWLGHLVAPLCDDAVGAATGYRWYTAAGGLASGLRSAWNAATVTMIANPRTSFCWGGSTAIRRETFERLNVARRWDRALSDDFQVTRAVRDAGLRIAFVPRALVPSHEPTTLSQFWTFARRQVVITRVCAPWVWRGGVMLCCNFVNGASWAAGLFLASAYGLIGGRVMYPALAAWAFILVLGGSNALVRQLAVRRILRSPDVGWRDFAWDVLGLGGVALLHLALLAASAVSRRIEWRGTVYELVSADETRIIRRPLADPQTPATEATPSARQAV